MKIISRFRDYYDGISAQYLDTEILYFRKTQWPKFTPNELKYFRTFHLNQWDLKLDWMNYDIEEKLIGFCGMIYKVVVIATKDLKKEVLHAFYSFDEVAKFYLSNHLDPDPFDLRGRKYKRFFLVESNPKRQLREIKHFFEVNIDYSRINGFFEKYQVPVFVLHSTKYPELEIETNPVLRHLQFQRIKDPFTAHQEIYQFVSSKLHQPENPMVQISDKDKLHKHGFDKFSFRTGPTKKR